MTRLTHRAALWLLAAALLFIVGPAAAHGYIVRAVPADRAVLERAPARLQYWFSEALEPTFSRMILRDQTGQMLAEGGVDPDNRALMTLQMPPGLPDGAYIVDLRPAFASDGHVIAESRVFFVGEAVGGVVGSSDYQIHPLEIIWRVGLLAALLLLFGVSFVYGAVLIPAWGSADHRAGFLPPRLMTHLNRIMGGALGVAFIAHVLALLQQSMAFFNTGPAEVISGGLWSVVRIGSRFGDVWNVRTLLLLLAAALLAASIYWRRTQPETVRPFWAAMPWAYALALGTFSVTSHAAGSLMWPWVAVTVDWLHTLAVGMWAGGLAALALIIPVALRPYSGDARRAALLAALRRFSRLALGAAALVIATGISSSLNWLYAPADLGTPWGGALVVKLALVAGLLGLGAIQHISANPERWARWAGRIGHLAPAALRIEALLALVVLMAVAFLAATPVPEPPFIDENPPAPNAVQSLGDLEIALTITPGGPGINTYDVALTRDGAPVEGAAVRLHFVEPERDSRAPPTDAEAIDTGLYVSAGAEIDVPGRWLALVDVTPPGADAPTRAAFAWDISAEAAVLEARAPGPLNVLALAGVLAAALYLLWPALMRFARWLDWSPASMATAVGATAATALFLIFGFILMGQNQAAYEAALNPTPALINPTLPDADSLARGAALFTDSCAWADSPRALANLTDRIPRLRDEELFAITGAGWQNLPACTVDLSDADRWHLVNYLRTLE